MFARARTLPPHAHSHTRLGVNTHIHVWAYTHICTRKHTHNHTHTHTHTHTHGRAAYAVTSTERKRAFPFQVLRKLDMEQLTAFDSWCAPAHCFLGEPIFVPEPEVCVYVGLG